MVGNALSVALVGELIPNIEEVIKDKLCYSYLLDKLILVTINICAFLGLQYYAYDTVNNSSSTSVYHLPHEQSRSIPTLNFLHSFCARFE
jgi:hypothetical protein